MSAFDVAICFSQNNLNRMVAALYSRPGLKTKLFSGRQITTIEGAQDVVAWDMRTSPVFNLEAPTQDQWRHAITANGNAAPPRDNACVVSLPNFHFSVTHPGAAPTDTTLTLAVICSIVVAGRTATVTPAGVVVDLSKLTPFDQIVYKSILIPQVLSQAAGFLGNQAVPRIEFYGLSFGNATLLVGQGRAIVAAYLEGKPGSPDRQALRATPVGDFHVLLSRDALQLVVKNGVQNLRGHTEPTGGHANLGIGNANYSASIRFDSLDASVVTSTMLHARASVTLAASAGVDVLPAILNQIAHGVTDAGQAVANAAKDATKAVAHGADDAGHAIVKAFKSY
jgi:hypothetical protein